MAGVEDILTNPNCGRVCNINGTHEHPEPEPGRPHRQIWTRGIDKACVEVDERGIVEISEAMVSQLLLDAGWERSA